MNERLLKAKMAYYGDSKSSLSKYLGMANVTLANKMNSTSEFTQSEIKKIIDRYHLSPDEVEQIFFAELVS